MCAKIIPGKLKNLWGTPGWEKMQCSHLALISNGYLTLCWSGPSKPIISYLVCVNEQGSRTPWPGSVPHCLTQVPSCLLISLFTPSEPDLFPEPQLFPAPDLFPLGTLFCLYTSGFCSFTLRFQLQQQLLQQIVLHANRVHFHLHRLFLSPLLRALELWILPQPFLLVFIHVCECVSAYSHILHVCVMRKS